MPGRPKRLFAGSFIIFGISTVVLVLVLLLVKPVTPSEHSAKLILMNTAASGYNCTAILLLSDSRQPAAIDRQSVFVYNVGNTPKSIRLQPALLTGIAKDSIPVRCNCDDITGTKLIVPQNGRLLVMQPSKQNLLSTLTDK